MNWCVAVLQTAALPLGYGTVWSGLRGSNSLPPPWQGGALPDELNPQKKENLLSNSLTAVVYIYYHISPSLSTLFLFFLYSLFPRLFSSFPFGITAPSCTNYRKGPIEFLKTLGKNSYKLQPHLSSKYCFNAKNARHLSKENSGRP